MITDNQTNKLYLSDKLEKNYPKFYSAFTSLLNSNNIQPEIIKGTKDIWAVDYMPVQIDDEKFVQFIYKPDYLNEYPELRTEGKQVSKSIVTNVNESKLVVDGGNVVRGKNNVIVCDKIFHENKKTFSDHKNLITELRNDLEVEKIVFVPWDSENDFIGHADGMVRFIDDELVYINASFPYSDKKYETGLRMALLNSGLDYLELPYFPPDDPTYTSAKGLYLNYLEMEQLIIMPTFGDRHDDEAYKILQDSFKGKNILTINCNEIAKEGGVLNCISWNIKF